MHFYMKCSAECKSKVFSLLQENISRLRQVWNGMNLSILIFQVPSKENISTLSALELAEQMTYLDQKILFTVMSSEFLEQAWLKSEKNEKSPHIVIMTKRFNDVSFLGTFLIWNSRNLSSDVATGCIWNFDPTLHHNSGSSHWKIHSCSGYLPMFA